MAAVTSIENRQYKTMRFSWENLAICHLSRLGLKLVGRLLYFCI